jgi:uncharacterized membrane protein
MSRPLPLQRQADDDPSLGDAISAQARERGTSELWTTAIGGGVNALLLWTRFASLHWLAAGFTAVAAYGAWGLLDRRMSILELENTQPTGARRFLTFACGIAAVVGCAGAVYALGSFLAAALGPLSLPGG